MRDITLGDTFYHQFTTRAFATGIPTTLSGTPVLSVLEENNATPITSGVSVSVDRATVTGLNEATIVATGGNGFESGKSYAIYISTGTVGGVSVVGEVVGQFTIEASAAAVDLANGTDGLGAIKTDTAAILDDTGTSGVLVSDGTGAGQIALTAGAIDTVTTVTTATNLTNLPSIPANWITTAGITDGAFTAAKFAASSLDGKGDWNTVVPDAAGTAPTAAEINAEVDTALADIGLDHLISSALPVNWATDVASGSVFDNIADDGTAAYDRTTDSLQAMRDHVGDGTNLTEAGGTGDQLTGITGVQLAADQAVDATKFGGAAVTATTSVTFPAASTVATTTGAVGSVTGAVGSVSGNVDGNVTGSVGSNLELGPAEVNAEVVDVLKTDTISEMSQAAPTATPTFEEAVMYLYMALRNRLDVDTTGGTDYKEFYNDAGTVIWKKAVSDDGSTYTEAEGITGP